MISRKELDDLGFERTVNAVLGIRQIEYNILLDDLGTKMVLTELSGVHELTIFDRFGAEVNLPTVSLDTVYEVVSLYESLSGKKMISKVINNLN